MIILLKKRRTSNFFEKDLELIVNNERDIQINEYPFLS